MGRITLELLRKKTEHNEGQLYDLEEISLHQEKIERIELLDKYCKQLKIILLQNNVISKIENVRRLKNLHYLNLALNNISVIENLEGCESLEKLDLTLNFVAKLSSVKSLRENYKLEQLFLMGNPCSEYENYREYIMVILPQLKELDGKEIQISERITARQDFKRIKRSILDQETGEIEREDARKKDLQNQTIEESKEYWNEACPNTPECRLELVRQMEKTEQEKEEQRRGDQKKKKKPKRLQTEDGRPLNINEAKLEFHLSDEPEFLHLDLDVPRFMCTSLIDVDVQPTIVKVIIKGKIFQLVLPYEIRTDYSEVKRSQVTGNLSIMMPKLYPDIKRGQAAKSSDEKSVIDLSQGAPIINRNENNDLTAGDDDDEIPTLI